MKILHLGIFLKNINSLLSNSGMFVGVQGDPNQNKHQNHRHILCVRMSCAFKNQNLVSNGMG